MRRGANHARRANHDAARQIMRRRAQCINICDTLAHPLAKRKPYPYNVNCNPKERGFRGNEDPLRCRSRGGARDPIRFPIHPAAQNPARNEGDFVPPKIAEILQKLLIFGMFCATMLLSEYVVFKVLYTRGRRPQHVVFLHGSRTWRNPLVVNRA